MFSNDTTEFATENFDLPIGIIDPITAPVLKIPQNMPIYLPFSLSIGYDCVVHELAPPHPLSMWRWTYHHDGSLGTP